MTDNESTASAPSQNNDVAKIPAWCLSYVWGAPELVGKRWLVTNRLEIGRSSRELPQALTSDPQLSRRHAELSTESGDLFLEDLGSHNGTKLNGTRLSGRASVSSGDVLELGHHLFLVDKLPVPFPEPKHQAFAGTSHALSKLTSELDAAAKSRSPILLLGPHGAGKTLAAEEIHRSRKRSGALVTLHASTLEDAEVNRVLFGVEDGEAVSKGLLAQADGGTLVIDRLESASPSLQSALVSFLESGGVRPVGQSATRFVDVCVVATSTASKQLLRESGSLSPELSHRLSAWCIEIPSLQERAEDIPQLAQRFLCAWSDGITMSQSFVSGLVRTRWDGNVRELFSFLEKAALEAGEGELKEFPEDMPLSSIMAIPTGATIEISRSGSGFRIGSNKVSLIGRRNLRALLKALTASSDSGDSHSLSIDDLFGIGWPGERVQRRASASRVYVAISSLRKMGLADVIERTGDGYRLVPNHRVIFVSEEIA